MTGRLLTANRGDSPCVCGAIHPCCRFLVDGGCSHDTPGDHHHAPNLLEAYVRGGWDAMDRERSRWQRQHGPSVGP